MTTTDKPWSDLLTPHDTLPSSLLRACADEVASDPPRWDKAANIYAAGAAHEDPATSVTLQFYAVAILALAAPRLPAATRQQIFAFAAGALTKADQADDEFTLESLAYLVVELGIDVIPSAVEHLRAADPADKSRYFTAEVLRLAKDAPEPVRALVGAFCLEVLRDIIASKRDSDDFMMVVYAITDIPVRAAEPFLAAMMEKPFLEKVSRSDPTFANECRWALKYLRGEEPLPDYSHHEHVEKWMESTFQSIEQWKDRPDDEDEFAQDAFDEEAFDKLASSLPPDDFHVPRYMQPIENTTPRVGRNEPCPCGSGKKYKKCCGK